MNIYINKHLLGQATLCGIIDICIIDFMCYYGYLYYVY